MAYSVNSAFDEFLRNTVRLDSDRSKIARTSKNNLVGEISKFPDDGEFLTLRSDFISIDYGSFSRKTKIRPLDDIDLMILLHAEGNAYSRLYNGIYELHVYDTSPKQKKLCNDGTNVLNSTKVINKFVSYLSKVASYQKAEIKKNKEAATLSLNSYEWVYDIVPCFEAWSPNNDFTFFLIPDGSGNWKPTDPRIDKARTENVQRAQTVSVLDMIRLMKYWTKRKIAPTMKSYFLENLVLNYYGVSWRTSTQWVDLELQGLFNHIASNIHSALNDPKGYQGDINHLTYEERNQVQQRALSDAQRATDARQLENDSKQKESIEKWGEIFGPAFPSYTSS